MKWTTLLLTICECLCMSSSMYHDFYTFRDGSLRTDDIVAEIASPQPQSHQIRSHESLDFAAELGVSTDADSIAYQMLSEHWTCTGTE